MKNKLLLLSSFVLFAASLPINQSQTYFVDSLDDASLKEKIKINKANNQNEDIVISDSIKVQYSDEKIKDDGTKTRSLRFVAGVSSSNIQATFTRKAIVDEKNNEIIKEKTIKVNYVYKSLLSGDSYVTANEVFNNANLKYFVAYTLEDIPENHFFDKIDLTLNVNESLSVSDVANVEGVLKSYYHEDLNFMLEEIDGYSALYKGNDKETVTEINIPSLYCTYENHVAKKVGNVTHVGSSKLQNNGFASAIHLRKVVVSEGIKTLGHFSFVSCGALEEVILPSTLEKIDSYVFNGTSSLKKLIIPKNVTSIGEGAFSNSNINLKVYFETDKVLSSWTANWDFNGGDTKFTNYYLYSENQPTSTGNYWHYVNNVVTEW